MEIEIEDNIVVDGSTIDPDSVHKPLKKLIDKRLKYNSRYVGGIHSLSMNDKAAWVRNSSKPLRIIEVDTGREEIWFTGVPDAPTYLSINSAGLLESHKKYNHHMPAVHYDRSSTPFISREYRIIDSHLDLWYHDCKLSNFEAEPALNAGSRAFKIRDTSIDYIKCIVFKNVTEDWDDGIWLNSRVSGLTIIFTRDDLNTESNRAKAIKWLNDHCKGGFFPFGDQLFGDKEEEFMFVADICT